MNNTLYWVWLTIKTDITPTKITSLLEMYNSITEIYEETKYANVPNIGSRELRALKDKTLAEARRIIDETEKLGAHIITFDDEDYPNKLRNCNPIPYVLYYKGEYINADDVLAIGVVGTRKYTSYGKINTTRISNRLASKGVMVVSGLARGNDTFAALGALRAGARTIGVLGCGIDVIYPPENERIINDVIKNGMLITEYPLGSPPLKHHFPERNRIIAALSDGVLVTDAPERSGSLITAYFAMEGGRDVFAVPRSAQDKYQGTNRLIQQGAKLVINENDILEEYSHILTPVSLKNRDMKEYEIPEEDSGKIPETEIETDETVSGLEYSDLTDMEKEITDKLIIRDMQIDELAQELNMSASTINTRLTMLELKGVVKKQPGGYFKIN